MSEWRSGCCEDEWCRCGSRAAAKVSEVIFFDDPAPRRHPLTAYVCEDCFSLLMGRHGVAKVREMRAAVEKLPAPPAAPQEPK